MPILNALHFTFPHCFCNGARVTNQPSQKPTKVILLSPATSSIYNDFELHSSYDTCLLFSIKWCTLKYCKTVWMQFTNKNFLYWNYYTRVYFQSQSGCILPYISMKSPSYGYYSSHENYEWVDIFTSGVTTKDSEACTSAVESTVMTSNIPTTKPKGGYTYCVPGYYSNAKRNKDLSFYMKKWGPFILHDSSEWTFAY